MIILLLCIFFSKTLSFGGLTFISILEWFNYHPFLAILLIAEIASYAKTSKKDN
jgi:hypothetical protein